MTAIKFKGKRWWADEADAAAHLTICERIGAKAIRSSVWNADEGADWLLRDALVAIRQDDEARAELLAWLQQNGRTEAP